MRKHFLILMLMALLPMAGWAADIEWSTAPAAAANLTYDGHAHGLLAAEPVAAGASDVFYAVTAATADQPGTINGNYGDVEATNAGNYKVWFQVGDAVTSLEVSIAKAANAYTAGTLGDIAGKTYDGTAVNLTGVNQGTFVNGTATIKFATSATAPANQWTTTVPRDFNNLDLEGKWYYKSVVEASDNYEAGESEVKSFVIAPVTITYFITGTTYNVGDLLDVSNHYSKASGNFIERDSHLETLADYAQFKFYTTGSQAVPVDASNHLTTKGSYEVSALRVVWNTENTPHNYDFRFTSSGKIIVAAKSIENFVAGAITGGPWTFDGTQKTPTAPALYPTQEDADAGTNALVLGVDYTVSYGANVNAGTTAGQIIYTANDDQDCNYDGEKTIYFEIKKADIVAADFTAPVAVEKLSYTAAAKNLITAGTIATDPTDTDNTKFKGTFEYQLNGGEWLTTIPQETNAADYTVKFRIKGGANYNDYFEAPVAPATVPTTEFAIPNVKIAKAKLVVQPDKELVKALYTGAAPTLNNVTVSYTKFYGDDNADNVFTTKPAISLADAVVTAGYAKGEYEDGVVVSEGVLSSTNYEVYPVNSKLEITAAKVKVKLKGGNGRWQQSANFGPDADALTSWELKVDNQSVLYVVQQTGYDDQNNPVYTTMSGTDLIDNVVNASDVLKVKTVGSGTAAVQWFDGLTITRAAGSAVGKYTVTLDGCQPKNDNFVVFEQTVATEDEEDPATDADFAPYFYITAQDVTVKAANKSKVYGTATEPKLTFTLVSGNLNDTQKATIEAALQREPGENADVYEINFKKGITSGEGPAIEGLNITYQVGAFAITPKTLTITANPQTLYSGNAVTKLDPDDYEVEGLVENTTVNGETLNDEANVTLALDKTVVYEFTSYPTAESTNPYATGTVEVVSFDATAHKTTLKVLTNVPANNNVLNANDFVGQTYIINADPTQFNATSAYQLFDGTTPLSIYVKGISQVSGVYVDATATPNTLNIPGEYKKAIKATLTNADALSANYDINIVYGKLTVIDSNSILVLDATANNSEAIEAADTKTVNVTFKNRILKANTWYTMVLPFDVKTTELVNVLKAGAGTQADPRHSVYAITNRMTSVSEGKINFTLEMLDIPANEPFLIKTAETVDLAANDVVFVNKDIEYDDAIVEIDGEKFIGTYAPMPLANTDTEWYGFLGNKDMKGSDGVTPLQNRWYNARLAGLVINSTEAYLQYAEAHAPMVTIEDFDFETGTTAIKTLNAETMEAYNVDGWYTLNGIKLQSMPTEKGVYINNGKKVVIK